MDERKYKVATFPNYGRGEPRVSKVQCYLRYYNEDWPGCVIYTVNASSGKEAKTLAAILRVADDLKKAERAHAN